MAAIPKRRNDTTTLSPHFQYALGIFKKIAGCPHLNEVLFQASCTTQLTASNQGWLILKGGMGWRGLTSHGGQGFAATIFNVSTAGFSAIFMKPCFSVVGAIIFDEKRVPCLRVLNPALNQSCSVHMTEAAW